jgi:diguanylate cyclase (GGDEF)-like protein
VPSELEELARENEALRRAVRTLHQVANLARASSSFLPTCYAILTGVTAGVGLGFNRAMLFVCDEDDRRFLRGVAAVGPASAAEADRVWRSIEEKAPDLQALYEAGLGGIDDPSPLERRVLAARISAERDSPVARALRTARFAQGGPDDGGGLFHLPTAVAAPMRSADGVQGVLYADNRFSHATLDPVEELVFSLVADHAGRALTHARQFEQLARQARTDALTGLGHHGAMMEALRRALVGARDDGTDVGLVMLDLDDFKQVNDRLGHLAGDALLAGVAARLRGEVRQGELPFRYGGEEFAVLLPRVESGALAVVGERLRRAIGGEPFSLDAERSLSVTCSVGLAARRGVEVADLIAAADEALLIAKRTGKNRVVVSP